MPTDDVIAEVRANREAFAAQFNFDLTAMVRHLQQQERTSGRVIIQPPTNGVTSANAQPPSAGRVEVAK
jgi:hypothetical protein